MLTAGKRNFSLKRLVRVGRFFDPGYKADVKVESIGLWRGGLRRLPYSGHCRCNKKTSAYLCKHKSLIS